MGEIEGRGGAKSFATYSHVGPGEGGVSIF